jgi:hypothetical protein
MNPQTKKRIIIWTSIAVILGVGGYFGYKKLLKPYLDKRRKQNNEGEQPTSTATTTQTSTTSSGQSPKTFAQAKKEAADNGRFAFQFTDPYEGKAYFSVKTGNRIFSPVAMPPMSQKGSITKVQQAIKKLGGNIVDDGVFGINTANAIAKYWNSLRWNPPAFGTYVHPYFSKNPFSTSQQEI